PVPATVGTPPAAAAPATPLPPPGEATPTAIVKPENTAAGPASPWKPPVVNIPGPASSPSGPPVPALPTLPTTPPPPADGKKSLRPVRPGADFALVDALDRPWDLSSGRSGSVVLLDFMTTSCVPCRKSVPGLIDLQSRYAADGLELVGVVCDDLPARDRLAAAEQYRRDHQLNYALYAEPGPRPGAVQAKFGVTAYPTAVLLDGEGNPVWKGNPLADHAALEAAVRRQLGR
ncbi:MAG: TlpA family protein disulfide reductase, partial [Gemmataceae bacterium]|nr:TlpA family protein disulfide reductase [Gemmataceae bacterium]